MKVYQDRDTPLLCIPLDNLIMCPACAWEEFTRPLA